VCYNRHHFIYHPNRHILLGHKKNKYKRNNTIFTPCYYKKNPSTPTIIKEETKEVERVDRRCPECGRIIPDDAFIDAHYCGKKLERI